MKLLLYCTKSKYRLFYDFIDNKYRYGLDNKKDKFNAFNGKIVAECDFEVEEFDYMKFECLTHTYLDLLNKSCLTDKEMYEYLKGKNGYVIHIKNLNIFDRPKELQLYSSMREEYRAKEKAPQNMCNVYYDEGTKHYILISIRPEWLCKILNREKTIEVRKKVLKEMLGNETR